jgi:hypothetical protein
VLLLLLLLLLLLAPLLKLFQGKSLAVGSAPPPPLPSKKG